MTVPEGWTVSRLGSLLKDIGDGGTPSRSKPEYFSGEIPWVVITDICPDISSTAESLSMLGLNSSSAKLWPENTVILSTGATIGEVGIARVPLATKQGITGMICGSALVPIFLKYWCEDNKPLFNRFAQGSTIKEVRAPTLRKFSLLLPPLPEQKKIAAILSSVDETIQATRETIEQTKRVKQGLMQELLTRGIGHTRFKKTEIGEIPKDWKIEKLRNVASLLSGQHVMANECSDNPIATPYLTGPADFFSGFIKTSKFVWNPPVICSSGDILITVKGSGTGKMIVADKSYCISRQLMAIHSEKIDPCFMGFVVESFAQNIALIATGIIPGISRDVLLDYPISLPPLSEQKKITAILSSVDTRIQSEESNLHQLEQIKKGLMQDLLTGKVRVAV